jgi:hypothetical protein
MVFEDRKKLLTRLRVEFRKHAKCFVKWTPERDQILIDAFMVKGSETNWNEVKEEIWKTASAKDRFVSLAITIFG